MRTIIFKDINNIECRLNIHSDADDTTGVLVADSVTVKSEEVNYVKDIISSSSLEFILLAEREGQYRDLYTTDSQGIKIELFRGDKCEFVGYLDSELYEEEFNVDYNYPINFKAGNVKILKRLDFDLFGRQTVSNIITHILNKVDIKLNFNSSFRSGVIPASEFNVECSIFHKEFESDNCYDVLNKILQPLLLMSYIDGDTLHIFDSYTVNDRPTINNKDIVLNDSVLSANECYNEVIINLDTASSKELYKCDIDKFEIPYPYQQERTIYLKQGASSGDIGFVQNVSKAMNYNEISLIKNSSVCRNSPRFSGQDEIYIRSERIVRYNQNAPNSNILFKSKPLNINTLNSPEWFINLRLDTLLSIRTNPFFGVAESDCDPATKWYQNHEKDFNNRTNYTFIFADVFLRDSTGNITHYLDNTSDNQTDARPATWKQGNATHKFKFAYYANMSNESGYSNGWQTNSPTVNARGTGVNYSPLTKSMQGKGTLCELPPVSGDIQVSVYEGISCWDGADGGTERQAYEDFKHLWFKGLELSICDANGHNNYSESEYEYVAELDNNAGESLELNNYIGCIRDNDYSCRAGIKDSAGKFLTNYTFGDNITPEYLELQALTQLNEIYKEKRYIVTGNYQDVNGIYNIYINELGQIFFITSFEKNICRSETKLTLRQSIL